MHYIHFCKPYNNHKDHYRLILRYGGDYGSSILDHVTSIYEFIFTFVTLITTKPSSMIDQITDLIFFVMITSLLIYVTQFHGSISISISPVTTKLDRMEDQHALTFLCSCELTLFSLPIGHAIAIYGFISISISPTATIIVDLCHCSCLADDDYVTTNKLHGKLLWLCLYFLSSLSIKFTRMVNDNAEILHCR